MRPWSGSIRRLIMRRVVVFPHPDGPIRTHVCASPISRLRSSTAFAPVAKRLVTCSSWIISIQRWRAGRVYPGRHRSVHLPSASHSWPASPGRGFRGGGPQPFPALPYRNRIGMSLFLDVVDPWINWDWLSTHIPHVLDALTEHVELTVIAIAIGLAISVPLGVLAHRNRVLRLAVLGFFGAFYTIPSLALFALLIPFTHLGG